MKLFTMMLLLPMCSFAARCSIWRVDIEKQLDINEQFEQPLKKDAIKNTNIFTENEDVGDVCFFYILWNLPSDQKLDTSKKYTRCLSTKTTIGRADLIKDVRLPSEFKASKCHYTDKGFLCICTRDHCNTPNLWQNNFFLTDKAAEPNINPKEFNTIFNQITKDTISATTVYARKDRIEANRCARYIAGSLQTSRFFEYVRAAGFWGFGKAKEGYPRIIQDRLIDDKYFEGTDPEVSVVEPPSEAENKQEQIQIAEDRGLDGTDAEKPKLTDDQFKDLVDSVAAKASNQVDSTLGYIAIVILVLAFGLTVTLITLICMRLTHHENFPRVADAETIQIFAAMFQVANKNKGKRFKKKKKKRGAAKAPDGENSCTGTEGLEALLTRNL